MKKKLNYLLIFYISNVQPSIYQVYTIEDLINFFPKTEKEIKDRTNKCISIINKKVNKIINIPINKRTFDNTIKAFDDLNYYKSFYNSLSILKELSPLDNLRNAADQQINRLDNFYLNKIEQNKELFTSLMSFIKTHSLKNINNEDKYYIQQLIINFKKKGFFLENSKFEKINFLKKELNKLSSEFLLNISKYKCNVKVNEKDLQGLDKNFVKSLNQENGSYILTCDYPTYFSILDYCSNELTRKKMFLSFANRAFPENIKILNEIIKKRDELAINLGYKSYNHLIIANQMAKTPSNVNKFLLTLNKKISYKITEEIDLFLSVAKTFIKKNKMINPWNLNFLETNYNKNFLKLDDLEISEYFPVKNTIDEVLKIFETFFSIKIRDIKINLWHEDLKVVSVSNNNNKLLAYIIFDIYPRDNKFTHNASKNIIPGIKNDDNPVIAVMLGNLTKKIPNQPDLFAHHNLKIFFHELGHIFHYIFGRTKYYEFTGSNTKNDFSEMPAQLLENWVFDKTILKRISRNYKTNEPLSEDLIEKVIKSRCFLTYEIMFDRLYKSFLSLEYFKKGKIKNTQLIAELLYKRLLKNILWHKNNHMQASFIHLINYGPLYYGYIWSNIHAQDVFSKIKNFGLMNPIIGQKYINDILSKGGSRPPMILLEKFLERQTNDEAYLKYLNVK